MIQAVFQPRDLRSDALGAFVPAVVLTGLGLICVFSFGAEHFARQAAWALLGVGACLLVARVPLEALRRCALPALAAAAALLAAALLFAPTVWGTKRWLVLPGGAAFFQPSELAKLAIVLYLAHRLAAERDLKGRTLRVLWPVAGVCVLVLVAPDLGTTVYLAAVAGALLRIGGARLGKVCGVALGLVPLLLLVASRYPYMQERLQFFRGELNYQQRQALLALGSGGFMGNGLGAGRQKMDYLPAGHTDFALANLGEELGFLGVCLVGLLFAMLLVHGVRVAFAAARAKERFGFFVACGATFVVVFQALLNIAVATAAAPTKGISLPFLSQGGSNLLVSLTAVGLILAVSRSLEART